MQMIENWKLWMFYLLLYHTCLVQAFKSAISIETCDWIHVQLQLLVWWWFSPYLGESTNSENGALHLKFCITSYYWGWNCEEKMFKEIICVMKKIPVLCVQGCPLYNIRKVAISWVSIYTFTSIQVYLRQEWTSVTLASLLTSSAPISSILQLSMKDVYLCT